MLKRASPLRKALLAMTMAKDYYCVYSPSRLKNIKKSKGSLTMSLTKQDVAKVARLARIQMDDDKLEELVPQLSNIIGFVEQLSEVNTDNVEPLASVVNIDLRLREDEVTDGGYAKEVLANAPEELEGYFVVPKVVE